eukprot:gene9715-9780_t
MTESSLTPVQTRRRRLLFRATHRGTHETDLLIGGFVAPRIDTMSEPDMDALEEVMELPDADLADWLTGRLPIPDHQMSEIATVYGAPEGWDAVFLDKPSVARFRTAWRELFGPKSAEDPIYLKAVPRDGEVPYRPLPPDLLYLTDKDWRAMIARATVFAFSPFAKPDGATGIDGGGRPAPVFAQRSATPGQGAGENVFAQFRAQGDRWSA